MDQNEEIYIRSAMMMAGMTPQSRAMRRMMGRFVVGGPRMRASRTMDKPDPWPHKTEYREYLLEDDHDESWEGRISQRARSLHL